MEAAIKKAKSLMLHQNWTMEAAFRAAFGAPDETEEITWEDREDYPAFSGALPFMVHAEKAAAKPPFDFYVVHRDVLDMLAPFEELGMYGRLVACNTRVIRADDLFVAARLQEAMPRYEFWVTPKFKWIGMTTPQKEDMWTAVFWALVLLYGEGSLEDGFGFPLSDRQKEAARKAFGSKIDRNALVDHTFVVGRR